MSMDSPFQPIDPTEMLHAEDSLWSGGCMVMAIAIEATFADHKLPGLVFRFAKADGSGFHPDVILVCSDDQLGTLKPLINEAIAAARRAAQMKGRIIP